MKNLSYLSAAVIAASLFGCSSSSNDNDAPTSTIAEKYQGVWRADAYASVFEINGNNVSEYVFSSDYCLLQEENDEVSTEDLDNSIILNNSATQFELALGFGSNGIFAPGISYTKVSSMPSSCTGNLIPGFEQSGYSKNYEQDLAIVHQFFQEHYHDFTLQDVDITSVYQEALLNLTSSTDEVEFAQITADMLESLKDSHIQVITSEGDDYSQSSNKPYLLTTFIQEYAEANGYNFPIPDEQVTQALIDELNAYIGEQYELQWELITDYAADESDIKSAANDQIRWFTNEGLGYLYIGGMLGFVSSDLDEATYSTQSINAVDQAIDQAFADFADVDALIVDVRTNGGGHDYISLAIASRFTAENETPAYSKQARLGNGRTELVDVTLSPRGSSQFLKPVVLLTSTNTVSAAETFTLSMSQLPNVTLMGESTQGAFSDVLAFVLPNGVEIGLSNEFYLSPQGEWFEGQGVPVDIEVPFFTQEQREQEIDAGIETAIEFLSE